MKRITVAAFIAVFAFSVVAQAKTLMLEGRLDSSIAMRQQMEFSVDKGTVSSFTFKFALPADDFTSRSVSQTVDSLTADYSPRPSSSTVEKDRFGNRFQKVTWNNLGGDVRINLGYTANVRSQLSAMESRTPFPIGAVSAADAVYLKSTEMVQSDSSEIAGLARRLTSGSKNQYEAVTAITNYVADSIKYTFNPPKYDALYTIETKSGNCQNFAHLCIALLRNVGIPARIVGGITLKDSWKVPIDNKNSIVQSMGQGGHAWMEIYFPDLGWLPYDPQQSRQFTSSRHIKQTHGLDSRDINDTWSGTPYLPRYSELIEGSFKQDDIKLAVKSSVKDPRPYILSNLVSAKSSDAGEPTTPQPAKQPQKHPVKPPVVTPADPPKKPVVISDDPPAQQTDDPLIAVDSTDPLLTDGSDEVVPVKPKVPPKKPKQPEKHPVKPPVKQPVKPVEPKIIIAKPKKPLPGTQQLLGNMEFPNLVNSFSVHGNVGTRILDKETSEYVTSNYKYAQAFTVKDSINLEKVSLAMRKFGGDGSVYVDIVKDDHGKPGVPGKVEGIRSNFIDLEKITRKPGYYWVDFFLPTKFTLKPGKYWIVFRASGEAIMNWFYIPGKPYSESDDTRSTAKGYQWEDILNYDFVFKVTGKSI